MAANVSDSYWQLGDAVQKDDFERVKNLVEKGAPVNGRVGPGHTLLMMACEKKNKAIVDLLLKRGAEVNKTNIWGGTALMYAAERGDEEIFDLLIKHNADVMMKTIMGWAAVHWAALSNRKSILDRLLLMGRQQCCSASGSPSPRETSCGSTVDIEDHGGRTPLWWAAFIGHVDCVDVLLVHGANPGHKSKWHGSPLDIAKVSGHTAIVSMMTGALQFRSNSLVVGKDRVICVLKEKIQNLEKDKEESEQSQWREVVRLREEVSRSRKELHHKDEKIKELESGIKQDGSTLDPERVLQAVISHGRDQWYSLCVQMGYSGATVVGITNPMPSEPDKIRAVFDKKTSAVGERAATQALLEACKRISDPIIGGVMDSLNK